ncbi:MAG: hypothetical protein K4H23_00125 [Mollicutes bacterium PWAP]|nr:hypothetical protein [Mollicutes bacterium PWAP]
MFTKTKEKPKAEKKKKKNPASLRFQKITKPLGKIGQQKHLSALRDGFALSLHLTIAGAVAVLFITIVFAG